MKPAKDLDARAEQAQNKMERPTETPFLNLRPPCGGFVEYEPGDIFDKLFGSGMYAYSNTMIEPGLLDTPLSSAQYREDRLQRMRLYVMARAYAKDTGNMDAIKIIANFDWIDIYDQPLPILLMLCQLIGISLSSYADSMVIKAMREHTFLREEHMRMALLDYIVK